MLMAHKWFDPPSRVKYKSHIKFIAIFGVSPIMLVCVWNQLTDRVRHGVAQVHLLCALRLIKVYSTDCLNSSVWG